MRHDLLFYDAVEDYVDQRAELRAEHLRLAWTAVERGELLLGGRLAAPVVTRWRVREWTTVVGPAASQPVRPTEQLP